MGTTCSNPPSLAEQQVPQPSPAECRLTYFNHPTQAFDFRDRYLEKAGAPISPGPSGCVSLGLKILTPSLLGLSFPSDFWKESSLGSSLSQQVWYNSNRSQAGSACISPSSGAFPVLVFL